MQRTILWLCVVILLGLTACNIDDEDWQIPPYENEECDDTYGEVTGGAYNVPATEPIANHLVVFGTAYHSKGLAIRQIRVAGIPATKVEFNFRKWSVQLEYELLAALARETDRTTDLVEITVDITATDACDNDFDLTPFTLTVDMSPAEEEETTDDDTGEGS